MNATPLLVGLALGGLAGAAHLAVTRLRASLSVTGHGGAAFLLLPLGFGAIAGAVLLAARIDKQAAWAVPIGLLAVRLLVLRRWRDRP